MEAVPWIYKINLCEEVSRMTLEKRFEQEMINIYTTAVSYTHLTLPTILRV